MFSAPSGDSLPIKQLCEEGQTKTIKRQTESGYKTDTGLCEWRDGHACVITWNTQKDPAWLCAAQSIPRGTLCDKIYLGLLTKNCIKADIGNICLKILYLYRLCTDLFKWLYESKTCSFSSSFSLSVLWTCDLACVGISSELLLFSVSSLLTAQRVCQSALVLFQKLLRNGSTIKI